VQIIIFGLGREGYSSYQFLRKVIPKAEIILTDDLPLEKLTTDWKTILIHDSKTAFVQTRHFNSKTDNQTVVVLSPGIKPTHKLLINLRANQAFITSNTQLFLEICRPDMAASHILSTHLPKLHKLPLVIGITGTKGKSTTTAVIYHLLEQAGLTTFLAGNIGKPALDLLPLMTQSPSKKPLILVLELSCHQLNSVSISPHIAVVQAITPEHLDYYPDFQTYQKAKLHITQFQKQDDLLIFNADNNTTVSLAQNSQAQKLCFSLNNKACACYLKAQKLYLHDLSLIRDEDLQLKGQHNLLNVMPAMIIAQHLGVSPKKINQHLQTFLPLPHRLELVTQQNGISFYNDSLSTTPESAIAAIKSFPQQSLILIAGGFDRGLDYSRLAKTILELKVKWAILLPETGNKIANHLKTLEVNYNQLTLVPTLSAAILETKKHLVSGDIVLLSPGSASFNQFKDYQDRGNTFKKLVLQTTNRDL